MSGHERQLGLTTTPTGTWVQVERAAMERWGKFNVKNPRAGALLMTMIANMGRHNALVASQKTLAAMAGCSLATLKRSLTALRSGKWIDVKQIGPTGTAQVYIINDKVAWIGNRDGIRYSMFSANVVVSDLEQPDHGLTEQQPLERLPSLFRGERQLPTGPGEDPPSQPFFEGLEPDLPAPMKGDQA